MKIKLTRREASVLYGYIETESSKDRTDENTSKLSSLACIARKRFIEDDFAIRFNRAQWIEIVSAEEFFASKDFLKLSERIKRELKAASITLRDKLEFFGII